MFCNLFYYAAQVDKYRHKFESGEPYIRGEKSAFLIMVLTFILVVAVFAAIYVHYEKEPKYENWVPISRLDILRRSVAFARFENRHNEDDNDTVNVGVRFDNNEHSDEKSLNDFNNPMYERKQEGEREQVTLGSVETEMLRPTTSKVTDESSTFTTDIKLVDISLNAINDKNQTDTC